jgi:hypothetical protein
MDYNFAAVSVLASDVFEKKISSINKALIKQINIVLDVIADDIDTDTRNSINEDLRRIAESNAKNHQVMFTDFLKKIEDIISNQLRK